MATIFDVVDAFQNTGYFFETCRQFISGFLILNEENYENTNYYDQIITALSNIKNNFSQNEIIFLNENSSDENRRAFFAIHTINGQPDSFLYQLIYQLINTVFCQPLFSQGSNTIYFDTIGGEYGLVLGNTLFFAPGITSFIQAPEPYIINYSTAFGTTPSARIVTSSSDSYTLTANDLPTLEDTATYVFQGWLNNGQEVNIGDIITFSSSSITLTANWKQRIQPYLTYSINWGTGNVYQKLSGKTYINPSGQTVDCSSVSVTFSSSRHFKKFYATAVKSGNNYGFENDVLVDLTTGTLLYELTERDANVNFTFTINTSSLTDGDGEYRIGLYVQDDDGIWNYEYFLLEANNLQLESSSGEILQVAVNANISIPEEEEEPTLYAIGLDYKQCYLFLYDIENNLVVDNKVYVYSDNTPQSFSVGLNFSSLSITNINNIIYGQQEAFITIALQCTQQQQYNYFASSAYVFNQQGWNDFCQGRIDSYTVGGTRLSAL